MLGRDPGAASEQGFLGNLPSVLLNSPAPLLAASAQYPEQVPLGTQNTNHNIRNYLLNRYYF